MFAAWECYDQFFFFFALSLILLSAQVKHLNGLTNNRIISLEAGPSFAKLFHCNDGKYGVRNRRKSDSCEIKFDAFFIYVRFDVIVVSLDLIFDRNVQQLFVYFGTLNILGLWIVTVGSYS